MHNNKNILLNLGGKTITFKKVMMHYTSTSGIRFGVVRHV